MNEWIVNELFSWFWEIGILDEFLIEVEEEEINGFVFFFMREMEIELKECLKLKVGLWIVFEYELLLFEKE